MGFFQCKDSLSTLSTDWENSSKVDAISGQLVSKCLDAVLFEQLGFYISRYC